MLHAQLRGEQLGRRPQSTVLGGACQCPESSFQAPYSLRSTQEVCARSENEAMVYSHL